MCSQSVGHLGADADLVGSREGSDTSGDDDIATVVVVVDGDCRSDVESDANGWREPVGATVGFECPLDRHRAVNHKRRVVKGCEEAVTCLLDDPALMFADEGGHCAVMPLTNTMPSVIADARQQRGGVHDVGEHECRLDGRVIAEAHVRERGPVRSSAKGGLAMLDMQGAWQSLGNPHAAGQCIPVRAVAPGETNDLHIRAHTCTAA